MTKDLLNKLIEARGIDKIDDLSSFANQGLITEQQLELLKKLTSDNSREKYNGAVLAFYEMQLTESLSRDLTPEEKSESAMEAYSKGKPHIALQLLEPRQRKIETDIPIENIEAIAKDFMQNLACRRFIQGHCIETCPYNMKWDDKYSCYHTMRLAYVLLRKYFRGNHRKASETQAILMESDRHFF